MMKALIVMCAIAILMMPALADDDVEYIDIETIPQGDGFRLHIVLCNDEDHSLQANGKLIVEYFNKETDTIPIKETTYQVNVGEFDLTDAGSWTWKSDRISNSDIPATETYFFIKATFIDENGKEFKDKYYHVE
jgi:hypothetical protein